MKEYFRTLNNEPVTPTDVDLFILNAGFESRSNSVVKNLYSNFSHQVLICQIDKSGKNTKPILLDSELVKNSTLHEVELSTISPIEIADTLLNAISLIPLGSEKNPKIAIDVTCFTHEVLLILLKVIDLHFQKCELFFFYTQAKSYDTDNSAVHKDLSYGVREIRSILGYSGTKTPSKATHLILLAGFEVERALSIISNVEPSKISIGYGDNTSIDAAVQKTNFEAAHEIGRRSGYENVQEFSFPPFDCVKTKQALEKIVVSSDDNAVIVPMNTKVSTIGAALLVKDYPKVQLIYGLAEAYNTTSYSVGQTVSFWFKSCA
jgi:hypothetical protein